MAEAGHKGTITVPGTYRGLSPSIYTGPVLIYHRQTEQKLKRIKVLALGLGAATLIVVGLACGGDNEVQPASEDFDAPPAPKGAGTASESPQAEGPSTSQPSTEPPLTSGSVAAREMIRCFPTGLVARVGASVGDSWTLAGHIWLQGKIPGPPNELRDGSAESSVTFTLTGLDDGGMNQVVDEATGKRARIENSVAYAHVKTVYLDDEGNIMEGTHRGEDLYNEALAAGFGTETIARCCLPPTGTATGTRG